MVIVVAVVLAATGAWVLIYTRAGSLSVSTTTPFVAAGSVVSFDAVIETPPSTSAGPVAWQFGDGTRLESSGSSISHLYTMPGSFFVGASCRLSNGATVDNFAGLFPIQLGPPMALPSFFGTTTSLGLIAINVSGSSTGAPLIALGGTIRFLGTVGQLPTSFYSTQPDPSANVWTNFTWAPIEMIFDFGDGSPPLRTADVADPFVATHTFDREGIHAVTLSVTTANFSATQTEGLPVDPEPVRVVPAQVQTTTVGQSVAVGGYRLVTYAGPLVNPGVFVHMVLAPGGYFTIDPAIMYWGDFTIQNVYETLLMYNGTTTDSFVPVVADSIPTVANSGVSGDYRTYSFHIRHGLKFSDGTAVTAWDVKYSLTRLLLFTYGSPPTGGWLLAQYLLPLNSDGTWDLGYEPVNDAITVDNASNSVTFHLVRPSLPLVMYEILASSYGPWIVSHTWLERVGPKLIWSEAGFQDYQTYGSFPNYIRAWQNGAVGSGPYMIDYTANPDAVVLKSNPVFVPVPGLPRPQIPRVIIHFVASADIRELSLRSGAADLADIRPTRFAAALDMQREGLVHILFAPTMAIEWWNMNMEIYQSSVGPNSNPFGNHVPPDFFVDLNMRKAFGYAFDYNQFLDSILGNVRFNATFAEKFSGYIPRGMIGYEDLSSTLVFDMEKARDAFNQTQWVTDRGWPNAGFTLTINTFPADPIGTATATAWAQNIESLGPGIHINVMPISDALSYGIPHRNPVAILGPVGWSPDYPFPSNMLVPILLPGTSGSPYGGAYPAVSGFNISYFASNRNGTNQVESLTQILNWLEDSIGRNATNLDIAIRDSRLAQRMAMNLSMYVPQAQDYFYQTYRTWVHGMEMETNPIRAPMYCFLTKEEPVKAASADWSIPNGLPYFPLLAPTALMSWVLPGSRAWEGDPAESRDRWRARTQGPPQSPWSQSGQIPRGPTTIMPSERGSEPSGQF